MTTDQQTQPSPETSGGPQTTTVNGKWVRKMVIFALILLGLGVYGLVDAGYVYPRRGYRASENLEYQYLNYLQTTNRLSNTAASVEDPKQTLDRLGVAIANKTASGADAVVHAWLEQLSFLGKLKPEHTKIPRDDFFADGVSKGGKIESAQQRWEALKGAPHAEALNSYDIAVQWLICAVGFVWGAYILVLMARVKAKRYSWDPAAKVLTLPTGEAFGPADILEFDKRRWHKFFVTITIKPGHAQLGGRAIELDLLRFVPLEDWVLEMERIAFPEEAAQSAGQEPVEMASETPA